MINSRPVLPRPHIQHALPGQFGQPVYFSDQSEDEADLRARIYEKYGVDHFVSDKISVHRSVGEHRNNECLKLNYDYQKLAKFKTSVIIGIYNEGWSALLRTIYSILHSTPDDLLANSSKWLSLRTRLGRPRESPGLWHTHESSPWPLWYRAL